MCLLGACEEEQAETVTFLLDFADKELLYTDEEIKAVVSTEYSVCIKGSIFGYKENGPYKVSVISRAVQNGHTEIVRFLLEKTQPTLMGSLVHLAARNGYLDILQLLITYDPKLVDAPDLYAQTPFLWAASCGHVPVLEYLYNHLKEQGDIEIKTIIKDDDRKHEDGRTALCWAAERGYVQTVKWLLERNANIYAKTTLGAMPIHLAAQNGHLNIIKILLDKDAGLLNVQDKKSQTPLTYTLDLDEVVEEKDVPYRDRIYETQVFLWGRTDYNTLEAKKFFCFAAQKGKLEMLHNMIIGGRNINVVQETGLNPVSLALEQGHIETPKLLLDVCPDLVNEPDREGKLPIQYAKSPGQKALLEPYNKAVKVADIEQFIERLLGLKQEQYAGYLESLYLAGQTPFDQPEAIIAFLQKLPSEKFNPFLQNAAMAGLLSLDRISDIVNPALEVENNNSYQSNSTFINQFIKPLNNERHTLEASICALEAKINSLPDSVRKAQFLILIQNLRKCTSGFFSSINGEQNAIKDSILTLKQSYRELITNTLNDLNEISTSEEREKIRRYQGILIALHIFIITIPFIWAIRASRNCILGKTDRCVKAEEVLEAVDEFHDKLPQYYPSIFAPAKLHEPTDLRNEVPPTTPLVLQ